MAPKRGADKQSTKLVPVPEVKVQPLVVQNVKKPRQKRFCAVCKMLITHMKSHIESRGHQRKFADFLKENPSMNPTGNEIMQTMDPRKVGSIILQNPTNPSMIPGTSSSSTMNAMNPPQSITVPILTPVPGNGNLSSPFTISLQNPQNIPTKGGKNIPANRQQKMATFSPNSQLSIPILIRGSNQSLQNLQNISGPGSLQPIVVPMNPRQKSQQSATDPPTTQPLILPCNFNNQILFPFMNGNPMVSSMPPNATSIITLPANCQPTTSISDKFEINTKNIILPVKETPPYPPTSKTGTKRKVYFCDVCRMEFVFKKYRVNQHNKTILHLDNLKLRESIKNRTDIAVLNSDFLNELCLTFDRLNIPRIKIWGMRDILNKYTQFKILSKEQVLRNRAKKPTVVKQSAKPAKKRVSKLKMAMIEKNPVSSTQNDNELPVQSVAIGGLDSSFD